MNGDAGSKILRGFLPASARSTMAGMPGNQRIASVPEATGLVAAALRTRAR